MAEQAQILNADTGAPVESDTATPSGGEAREVRSEPSRRERLRVTKNTSGAADGLTAATATAAKSTDKISRGTVDGVADPDAPVKAWEAPKYASAWKDQRRKALEAIATNESLKDHWKELDGQLNEFHDWDSRRNWQIGEYRKQFDPIAGIVGQMSQQYQLQGMSLEQGLGQMWAISQRLAQDPDSTLAWLGTQFKPRNPQQAAMQLAQAWGLNLGELAQGQPYVDPVVARQLHETQSQLQRMQQAQAQQQQAAQQQQYQALIQHITAFEQAKDASGNLKYPFATEVGQEIGMILQMGKANSLEQAYEMATKYHPKAQEDRQKAAEKAAREAAARTTSDAEQARAAGRNVNGKPTQRSHAPASMLDAIKQAQRTVYGKTS